MDIISKISDTISGHVWSKQWIDQPLVTTSDYAVTKMCVINDNEFYISASLIDGAPLPSVYMLSSVTHHEGTRLEKTDASRANLHRILNCIEQERSEVIHNDIFDAVNEIDSAVIWNNVNATMQWTLKNELFEWLKIAKPLEEFRPDKNLGLTFLEPASSKTGKVQYYLIKASGAGTQEFYVITSQRSVVDQQSYIYEGLMKKHSERMSMFR